VSNICVYASTDAKQPIAIITLHEGNLRHAVQTGSLGVDADAPLSVLCHNDKVKELVLKECNAVGKKSGFKPMEMLQAVILASEEWTPENGLVTAAQKLQRKKIADMCAAEIKVRCALVFRGWFSNSQDTGGLQKSMIVLSLVTIGRSKLRLTIFVPMIFPCPL
jgi:long-subunit acyl-CoA synthetase (AMP-forming)